MVYFMKQVVQIAKSPSYRDYIKLVNGIFKLTDKEIEVLAKFVEYQLNHNRFNVFTAEFKKRIAKDLGMDDFNILNIYIKSLKEKRAITPDIQGYKINKLLVLNKDQKGLVFQWE